jgi:hypothetical protein
MAKETNMSAPRDGHHYDIPVQQAYRNTMGEAELVTPPQDTSRFEDVRPAPASRADDPARWHPGEPTYPA